MRIKHKASSDQGHYQAARDYGDCAILVLQKESSEYLPDRITDAREDTSDADDTSTQLVRCDRKPIAQEMHYATRSMTEYECAGPGFHTEVRSLLA